MFYQLTKKILTIQMFCHLKIVGLLLNQCEYLITKYLISILNTIFSFSFSDVECCTWDQLCHM